MKASTSPVLVAIGSSTGGPGTLRLILKKLPADLPGSIVIVQHMAEGRMADLRDILAKDSRMEVMPARDGKRVQAGQAYLAPGGRQNLNICKTPMGPVFEVEPARPDQNYWPSIDTLFEGAAQAYGSRVIAVLLSGMGTDGARGLNAIRQAGGVTIAESEASSVVFGMPRHAIAQGVVEMILPKERMASVLWGQVLSLSEGRDGARIETSSPRKPGENSS